MKATRRKTFVKKLRKSIQKGGSKSRGLKTMTPAQARHEGKILFPHGLPSANGKLRYALKNSGEEGHLTSLSVKPVALVNNGKVSVYAPSHAQAGQPKMELRPVIENEPIENFTDVRVGQRLLVESFDRSNPVLSVRGREDAEYSAVLTVKNIEQPEWLRHEKAIVTFEEKDPATRTNVQLYINPWQRGLEFKSNYYAFKPEKSEIDQMKFWGDK